MPWLAFSLHPPAPLRWCRSDEARRREWRPRATVVFGSRQDLALIGRVLSQSRRVNARVLQLGLRPSRAAVGTHHTTCTLGVFGIWPLENVSISLAAKS